MGYLHIDNLYKNQTVLVFKECYAMEKIHGTSAHVAYTNGTLRFFSGGEKHERFVPLFDQAALLEAFQALGHEAVVVFGEAYGGKCQGMSHTYGKSLAFIVFDVKVGGTWLNVPNAADVASKLSLEFVPYERVPATVEALNVERDKPSRVAVLRGIEEPKPAEGVVVRPLEEFRDNRGNRVIAKHKADAFQERRSTPKVVDPEKWKILNEARDIAQEWVTDMRLTHVLDKLQPPAAGPEDTPRVIKAVIEDVFREAEGEVVETKATRKEVGRTAANLYIARLKRSLEVGDD